MLKQLLPKYNIMETASFKIPPYSKICPISSAIVDADFKLLVSKTYIYIIIFGKAFRFYQSRLIFEKNRF